MQLGTWSGWRKVEAQFEASGYGLIGQFSHIASDLCGGTFSAEDFHKEQCEHGEKYMNRILGERARPVRGELRTQLQQVLGQISESERLAKFDQRLYALCDAEIAPVTDDFEIASKKDVRDYAERASAELGFGVE